MGMKVLIITNHYLDNKAGGTFASLAYINAFASLYQDCTVIYPSRGTNVSHLLLPGVKTIPCLDNRLKWQKGAEIYLGKLHRFGKVAIAALKEIKPDIVVFDTSIVSCGLVKQAKKSGIFTITIHHNVEYDYLRDNQPSLIYRYPYRLTLSGTEATAVKFSDLNLTLTLSDSVRLAALYAPQNIHNIKTSGVFEMLHQSLETTVPNLPEKREGIRSFIITGNLSFPQSDLSTCEFIKNLWPVLKSQIKGCNLVIAGSNPSSELIRLTSGKEDLQLVANPVNINEILAGCDCYLCPVDRGSGFKFRILDGLRRGMPVIAHEVSARGYDQLIITGNLLVYNSETSFKNAVQKLIQSKFDNYGIQNLYKRSFSFEHGLSRLEILLKEAKLI